MRMIVAIIQPQQLPAVKRSLFDSGVTHMTCTNVLGTAPEGAEVLRYRGVAHSVTLFQKVRIEIAVKEALLDRTIDAITRGARESGGFGMIFVTELHDVIHVRTGQRGQHALH